MMLWKKSVGESRVNCSKVKVLDRRRRVEYSFSPNRWRSRDRKSGAEKQTDTRIEQNRLRSCTDTDRQTDRDTERDTQRERERERERERQTKRLTDRQTDRQTDRLRDSCGQD